MLGCEHSPKISETLATMHNGVVRPFVLVGREDEKEVNYGSLQGLWFPHHSSLPADAGP
jgi:hypothetical protein